MCGIKQDIGGLMVTLEEWENRIEALVNSRTGSDRERLAEAVDFARMAHAGDFRKNTKEPYIVHPLEVCLVASTVTGDIDVLIAALLHDVVEDTSHTLDEIRDKFGDRVAGFVGDESENKIKHVPKNMSWLVRKENFIEHLKSAPVESKTICLADKISNLRSTLMMYIKVGDKIWDDFNQKKTEAHAWYYRSIAYAIVNDFKATEAFDEYCDLYHRLFGEQLRLNMKMDGGFIMEINEKKCEDDIVYVEISGRITSNNADEMYSKAQEIIAAHPGLEMVYDLEGLEMISSAGLRVFLKIKKSGIKFRIINASSEVYDVFEITGFVQMFDINKAYRKMSVDGCTVIGEGAKGIVYKIDDETIIKVYKDSDCMNEIISERECAKKALVMGVPTAIPFDIVLVGDKYGSVFELVNAKSVTKTIADEPEKMPEVVKEYARIMREMHALEDNGSFGIALPAIKNEVKTWAEFAKDYVSPELYEKIAQYADSLKDCNNILHGDGHPNNVMCTRDELLFIDMDTLCVGESRADVAVVYTAIIGYKMVDPENKFISLDLEKSVEVWKEFVKDYLGTDDEKEVAELQKWCEKFCYLRLFRRGIRKEKNPSFAENAKVRLEKAFAE